MSSFLFTNSFFEEELKGTKPILALLRSHPVHLHLHYLSSLFSKIHTPLFAFDPDPLYVASMQKKGFLQNGYALLDEVSNGNFLHSFAPSEALADFALTKELTYPFPNKHILLDVHSKKFSFLHAPKLPGSKLLQTEKDLVNWWHTIKGAKVLKNFLGVSGRGHFLSNATSSNLDGAKAFLSKHPEGVIGEPWKKRCLDFSSHWHIEKEGPISYIGSTICINSLRGGYKKTIVDNEDVLFRGHHEELSIHKQEALKLLQKIASTGFFGPIGIDAMLYEEQAKKHLHPIVEVNARNTMGSYALKLWKELQWEDSLSLRYEPSSHLSNSLLPLFALDKNTKARIPLFPATLEIKKGNLIY